MGRPRRNWTEEEDTLLRSAVNQALAEKRPLLWRELAKSVPDRSNKDCRRRWWNNLADGMSKGPWSEAEDKRLIEAIAQHGTRWSKVAEVVCSRNSNQCSSHWSQVLDPNINYCDWSIEEDRQLLDGVQSHGTNWATIAASHVPKRTTLALKNRFSMLRMKQKNSSDRSTSASSPSSTSSTSLASMKKDKEINSRGANRDNRADEDEQEEDDDDDCYGGDDGEEDDDFSDSTFMAHLDSLRSTSNKPPANVPSSSCPTIMPTSGAWAGFGDPSNMLLPNNVPNGAYNTCTDYWMNDANDPAIFHNPVPPKEIPVYPTEGFHSTAQDPRRTSMGMIQPAYGGDAMDVTFSPGQQLIDPAALSNGHLTEAERQISNLDLPSAYREKDPFDLSFLNDGCVTDTEPSSKNSSASSDIESSGHYDVNINMRCTASQLNHLIGAVTVAGTGVRLKIDPQ